MRAQIEIDVPEFLADSSAPDRAINQIAKSALSEELVKHHQTRIPKHFEAPAHATYHYMNRGKGYQIYKARKYGKVRDLSKSGLTEQVVERVREIRLRGQLNGGAGGIEGDLIMHFPFPGGGEETSRGVTMQEMKDEITATTDEEREDILHGLSDRMGDKLAQYISSGRRQRFYRVK